MSNNLKITERFSRYLITFSFISVIVFAFNKSADMLRESLSTVYIYQSNVPYFKVMQLLPAVLFIYSVFLLCPLSVYLVLESTTFVNLTSHNIKERIARADTAYKSLFYHLTMVGISLVTFIILACIFDRFLSLKVNFIISYVTILSMIYFISIIIARKLHKKTLVFTPSVIQDIIYACVFVIYCIGILRFFYPFQTNVDFKVDYSQQYITVTFAGNTTFDKISIWINDELSQEIQGNDEYFFSSSTVAKSSNTDNVEEVYMEINKNSEYFYFSKTIDISYYSKEGYNNVCINVNIDNQTTSINNPFTINNSTYSYMKEDYMVTIQ